MAFLQVFRSRHRSRIATAKRPIPREATALGKKFSLPLRYHAKVNRETEEEASKFFTAIVKQ